MLKNYLKIRHPNIHERRIPLSRTKVNTARIPRFRLCRKLAKYPRRPTNNPCGHVNPRHSGHLSLRPPSLSRVRGSLSAAAVSVARPAPPHGEEVTPDDLGDANSTTRTAANRGNCGSGGGNQAGTRREVEERLAFLGRLAKECDEEVRSKCLRTARQRSRTEHVLQCGCTRAR